MIFFVFLYMESLETKFPNLAVEWDYEKNGNLSPSSVTPGSRLKVYWKCSICGRSYAMRVSNRTAPSKQNKKTKQCPICRGQIIIPGYNSLEAKYPDIVKNEWDFELNEIDPDTIAPHTNKAYYWKCLNGHESYQARVNNKISKNGGNCPKCSHQKFSKEFSLQSINPELAREWDIELNGGVSPDEVFANSNKEYWWRCPKCGHAWKAKVNNRSNGRGCPNCVKGLHTSFPEQVVFHYIKMVFPDAINNFKLNRKELDVFIPSLRTGIEYDGEAFHRTAKKVSSDVKKTEYLNKQGIRIIRIRECGCAPFSSSAAEIIRIRYSADYRDLQHKLQLLLTELCRSNGIKIIPTVDIEAIRNEILAKIYTIPYEESFAAQIENSENEGMRKIAQWDYVRNNPLMPIMVRPFSEKRVYWVCPNNPEHKWRNTVKSVSLGFGCPFCSKKHRWTTEEWVAVAQGVHGNKYDYSKVDYINSKTPVEIICPKHGLFTQIPTEHLSGKGCKFCAHQAFHPKESLAVISPEIAKQWDYDRNKESGVTPETIGINSTIRFWWHCTNGQPHSFQATIAKRVNGGVQCAICHGKQMAYDRSLEANYPQLAKEWSPDNDKKPSAVSCGSEYKAKWRCLNPSHPIYEASVYSRAHLHSGCPLCARERIALSRKKHNPD